MGFRISKADTPVEREGKTIKHFGKHRDRHILSTLLTPIAVIFALYSTLAQAAIVELGAEIEALSERPEELKVFLARPEFTDLYSLSDGQGRWLKINIQEQVDRGSHWSLMVGAHAYNRVDVFVPHQDNGYLVFNTGYVGHNRARLMYMYRAVPLNYKVETQPLFIWAEDSPRHPLALELWTRDELPEYHSNASLLIGIYVGILLAMLVYNGFIYLALLDKAYLFYVLLTSNVLLFVALDSGFLNNRMTGLYTWLGSYVTIIVVALLNLGTIAFARSFIDARTGFRHFYKLLDTLIWVFLAIILVALVNVESMRPSVFSILNLASLITMVGLTAFALFAWRAGNRSAMFFFISFTLTVVFAIIRIMGAEGVIADNWFSRLGVFPASAAQLMLLSLGLVDRIGRLRQEHDQAAADRQNNQQLALTDNLTGVFGRRQILDAAREMFISSRHHATDCCVMMINIDGFSAINEQCGQGIGDTV